MGTKSRPKRATSANREPIHRSIKERLGYAADEPDAEVLRDWRARLRRVCKPCWELRNCPFGPLVEAFRCSRRLSMQSWSKTRISSDVWKQTWSEVLKAYHQRVERSMKVG